MIRLNPRKLTEEKFKNLDLRAGLNSLEFTGAQEIAAVFLESYCATVTNMTTAYSSLSGIRDNSETARIDVMSTNVHFDREPTKEVSSFYITKGNSLVVELMDEKEKVAYYQIN